MVKQIQQSILRKQGNEQNLFCEQPGIVTLAGGIGKIAF